MYNLLTRRSKSLFEDRTKLLTCSVLEHFNCHYKDEVTIYGHITGQPVPPFACKFSSTGLYGNLLSLVDEEGSVRLLDTRQHVDESLIKEWSAHKNAIFDVAWIEDTKLVTASGDPGLVLWDVHTSKLVTKFKGHTASIKSVDVQQDNPAVLISGGRDGCIMMWDTRCATKDSQHKPVNSIFMAHKKLDSSGSVVRHKARGRRRSLNGCSPSSNGSSPIGIVDHQNGVTSVLFHQNYLIASVGTADGVVKLWDTRRTYSHMTHSPPQAWFTFSLPRIDPKRSFGFTSLVSDPYNSCLYASCMDNIIYVFDSIRLKGTPVKAFSGHKNSTFYIKSALSYSGRFLISGSSCGNIFIWDTENPLTPPTILLGHTKEVTAVAWAPYQLDKIASCSDACDFRIWCSSMSKIPHERYIGYAENYTELDYQKGMKLLEQSEVQSPPKILKSVENILPSPVNGCGQDRDCFITEYHSPTHNKRSLSHAHIPLQPIAKRTCGQRGGKRSPIRTKKIPLRPISHYMINK